MAMLAEKRTKTRYYLHHKTLNPRGNVWCEDNNKFGQRMLEKMGWAQGKGLGVKEDGSTDPVHVSYKWDNKGMGYKGADGDEAVAQQKDFDALLATLSEKTQSPEVKASPIEASKNFNPPASLELRSQKSRARVHYHKFTRGKDLSRATSKDLASILGMAVESKTPSPAPCEPVVVPDVGPPIESSMETTFGITTIARGNINEYFKQKYKEMKRKSESTEAPSDPKKSKDLHVTNRDDLSITSETAEDRANSNKISVESDKAGKEKRKKKKKIKHLDIEANEDTPLLDQTVDDINTSSSKSRRKSVTWGDVEVSFVSKYIKEMVDTSSESASGDLTFKTPEDHCEGEESNVTPDKKKKKKKKKDKKKDTVNGFGIDDGLDGLDLDYSADDVFINNDDTDIFNPDSGKKKKKRKVDAAEKDEGIESISFCQENVANLLKNNESSVSVSNKKKKRRVQEIAGTKEDEVSEESNSVIKKQKKNKSRHELIKSTEVLSLSTILDNNTKMGDNFVSCNTEISYSKKKKKKLKDQTDNDIGENEDTSPTLLDNSEKKRRKQIASAEDKREIQKDDCLKEKKERKGKKENLLGDTDDLCLVPEIEAKTMCDNVPEVVPVGTSVEKKRKKKKKSQSSSPSDDANEDNTTESKKKDRNTLCKEMIGTVSTLSETNNQPMLSALTQSRMMKWKERRKNKESNSEKDQPSEDVQERGKTSSQTVIEVNPGLPSQNYNHRRVLAALGYNVKQSTDKNVTILMPPSDFEGSNLDSIPGYGQVVKSC